MNEFESGVHKLPIFEHIHNAHSDYDRRSRHSLDIVEDNTEKSSAQSLFKEIALEIKKTFTSGSIDKSNGSSKKKNSDGKAPSKSSIDEQEQRALAKLDLESSGRGKRGQCFDIAAQMKGVFGDDASSIDSA